LIAIISGVYEEVNDDKDLFDVKELIGLINEFDTFWSGCKKFIKFPAILCSKCCPAKDQSVKSGRKFYVLVPAVSYIKLEDVKSKLEGLEVLVKEGVSSKLESLEVLVKEGVSSKLESLEVLVKEELSSQRKDFEKIVKEDVTSKLEDVSSKLESKIADLEKMVKEEISSQRKDLESLFSKVLAAIDDRGAKR
jgi:hypothetical protein